MLNQNSTPKLPSFVLPSLANDSHSRSGPFYHLVHKHKIIVNSAVVYAEFPKLRLMMALRPFLPLLFFKEKNKKDSLFHDDNLMASILDLVMAGTETIATTLQWAILLMMKYPEIQSELLLPTFYLWHG